MPSVEGGSQQGVSRIRDRLQQQDVIEYNKRVVAMAYTDNDHQQIDVIVEGEEKPRQFDAVLNSAT